MIGELSPVSSFYFYNLILILTTLFSVKHLNSLLVRDFYSLYISALPEMATMKLHNQSTTHNEH